MKGPVKPRLVFVHGIGGSRDPRAECDAWLRALADGARRAGHSGVISALVKDWAAESRFAYYGDLFGREQSQGGGTADQLGPDETEIVVGFLNEIIETQLSRTEPGHDDRLTGLHEQLMRFRTSGERERQGSGEQVRRLSFLFTSVLSLPGLRQTAQWASGKQLLSHVSQAGRYLSRNPAGGANRGLDQVIRERVLSALEPDRPTVVVAHSLGTVVALEALQEFAGPVPLFVTLGSPLATPAVVLPRLRPQPPATPSGVGRWLDFWDRDDIVVPKRRLADCVGANAAGARPQSRRVDSDGLWVHTATKYLRQSAVAGPIVEEIGLLTGAA
ncbi:hypothetical protein [Kitasatospora sp. P5_F3]